HEKYAKRDGQYLQDHLRESAAHSLTKLNLSELRRMALYPLSWMSRSAPSTSSRPTPAILDTASMLWLFALSWIISLCSSLLFLSSTALCISFSLRFSFVSPISLFESIMS